MTEYFTCPSKMADYTEYAKFLNDAYLEMVNIQDFAIRQELKDCITILNTDESSSIKIAKLKEKLTQNAIDTNLMLNSCMSSFIANMQAFVSNIKARPNSNFNVAVFSKYQIDRSILFRNYNDAIIEYRKMIKEVEENCILFKKILNDQMLFLDDETLIIKLELKLID